MSSAPTTAAPFTSLPDLASRALRGGVVWASDELFAGRENLIKPSRPRFDPDEFGDKGKVYDGWETRRRRTSGVDHAIVRLGTPGVVAGVVIDTTWFRGNFPPAASVEAIESDPHASVEELLTADWEPLLEESALHGDCANEFAVSSDRRVTHVRLSIYPDGGVARFRVHARAVPDRRLLVGTIDLAALENGGDVLERSDAFFSSPQQILLPGPARSMGEGWENARRRSGGNDFVTVRLAGRGRVRRIEVDTSYFVGNAPGWVAVRALDEESPEAHWFDLVPYRPLQPDTRHQWVIEGGPAATRVRLDVFPDGGIARFRVHGELGGSDFPYMSWH